MVNSPAARCCRCLSTADYLEAESTGATRADILHIAIAVIIYAVISCCQQQYMDVV